MSFEFSTELSSSTRGLSAAVPKMYNLSFCFNIYSVNFNLLFTPRKFSKEIFFSFKNCLIFSEVSFSDSV